MRYLRGAAMACAFCLALLTAAAQGRTVRVNLSGVWELNRDLSSAPGSGPSEPGGRGRGGGRGGGPGGGRSPGGGGRGPGGGGFGGGFGGGGGGRSGGAPPAGAPSREDMEARRALLQEAMTLPVRLTITQDGDKVALIEPDGVVRTYVANGASEKHQLTTGTIETRSQWEGASLRMEIRVGERMKIIRTFEVGDDPRRLEIGTGFDGGAKDQRQRTVYDEAPSQH